VINKKNGEDEDFVSEDFVRHERSKPKLIKFGSKWDERPDKSKIEYLHKLASSLNESNERMQKELNEANELLFEKESQLTRLNQSQRIDRQMIHRRLAAENAEKQKLLEENVSLRKEIKSLTAQIEG
jgi:hypothetical protein